MASEWPVVVVVVVGLPPDGWGGGRAAPAALQAPLMRLLKKRYQLYSARLGLEEKKRFNFENIFMSVKKR